jgi:hypothetical protein
VRLSLTTFGPQAKNIASSSYIRARTAKLKEVISGLFFLLIAILNFKKLSS